VQALAAREPVVERRGQRSWACAAPKREAAEAAFAAGDARQATASALCRCSIAIGARSAAQLAPVDDHVDRAGLQQELGALEASGSFSRTVFSMTRGPAKPISAFGSAMTTSPTNAKLPTRRPSSGRSAR
jgi:hypothetical protein